MAGELLIATNPRRRKGHRTAKQRAASLRNIKKAQAAWRREHRGGRHTHRRRRNPESRTERSRAAKLGWRRRRHNPETRAERSRAAKAGWRHRRRGTSHRRRRNPSFLGRGEGILQRQVMPAAVGAGGAVVNELGYNAIVGFLPAGSLATNLQTGAMRHLGKALSAVSLTWLARYFLHPRTADELGAGALTVIGYNIAKDALAKMAPNSPHLQLGCYDGMGAYVDGYPSAGAQAGVIDMRTGSDQYLNAYEASPGIAIPAQLTQPAGVSLEGYQEGSY